MKDVNLRKTIGNRAKQRRQELKLDQKDVAQMMDVNASTIQRYEAGKIDNTKKLVVEGLSKALHVSVEWLRGETDEYETDVTDSLSLQIREKMNSIFQNIDLNIGKDEDLFAKSILLLMLCNYESFTDSYKFACSQYATESKADSSIYKTVGFASENEFKEVMFLREITSSINTLKEIGDILTAYPKNSEVAANRLNALLDLYL